INPGDGGSISYVVADVTNEDEVEALCEAGSDAHGHLHGFVANAGGGGAIAPFHLQDTDEFKRVLELNVVGTMLSIKHSVGRMVAAGGGSFVGMSSIAGDVTHIYFGAYTAAKAGIEAMMRNAADEFGVSGLRFNAVRPGFTTTEIMEGVPRDSEVYASYIENTPMNGVGEPEDVAALVRFLIGPDSRWITGQIIAVDGGNSLRRGPNYGSFIEPVFGSAAMAGEPYAAGE
ncbi:MAG: SDR family oxidoreductase, partial [Acidobacteria bacterium]|nr:SDR family oxidoreductase [Acidobacteriota bacterium]